MTVETTLVHGPYQRIVTFRHKRFNLQFQFRYFNLIKEFVWHPNKCVQIAYSNFSSSESCTRPPLKCCQNIGKNTMILEEG